MGLFGIAIGKKATAAKAAVKLEKIKARQSSKTDRTTLRQTAKVDKATVKAGADIVAYENGVTPQNNVSDITGVIGQGIKAVASIYGGNSQSYDVNGGTDPQVAMSGGVKLSSSNMDGMFSSPAMPMVLIGGVLLLLMLKKK